MSRLNQWQNAPTQKLSTLEEDANYPMAWTAIGATAALDNGQFGDVDGCNHQFRRQRARIAKHHRLFDQSRVYGTPSYWVQTMYAANRGDRILPVQVNMPAATPPPIAGKIGVGTWGGTAMFKDIVVSNQTGEVLYHSNFTNGIGEWQLEPA